VLVHGHEFKCDSALLKRCHFADGFGILELVCDLVDHIHSLEVEVADGLGLYVVRSSALTSVRFTLFIYGKNNFLQVHVLWVVQGGLQFFKHLYFEMGLRVVGHFILHSLQ